MIAMFVSHNKTVEEKDKGDFVWIFSENSEDYEDDKKFRDFLKKMYLGSQSSFLILKQEEEYILKKYKQN
jgi:hypothetical protein